MTIRCLCIFTLVLTLASSTHTARAEPASTEFNEVVAQSETIAVIHLKDVDSRQFKVRLNIKQVFKGSLKPGEREVTVPRYGISSVGHLTKNRELIGFIDHGNVWRFLGISATGKAINSDVFELWGFNDDEGDIHFVTPGLLTLAQLKTYLKNKTLRYPFRGDVYFPRSGKGGWQVSDLQLTGTYDAITDTAQAKGFAALAVYSSQPEVRLTLQDGPRFNIVYSDKGSRRLDFGGRVVGVDPRSGDFLVKFSINWPTLLNEEALKRYLGNPRPATPVYTFHLNYAPSRTTKARELSLVMHDQVFGHICGWSDRPLQIAEAEFSTPKPGSQAGCLVSPLPAVIRNLLSARDSVLRMAAPTRTGEFLILAFELGEPSPEEFPRDNDCETKLLYGVLRGHSRGTLQIHDGTTLKEIAPFSVTFDRVEFEDAKTAFGRNSRSE
jgi:hypothetical protein